MLVYDITSQCSFDNITRWLQNIEAVSMYVLIKSLIWVYFSIPHEMYNVY